MSKQFFLTILCCELKLHSENRNLKDLIFLCKLDGLYFPGIGIRLLIRDVFTAFKIFTEQYFIFQENLLQPFVHNANMHSAH